MDGGVVVHGAEALEFLLGQHLAVVAVEDADDLVAPQLQQEVALAVDVVGGDAVRGGADAPPARAVGTAPPVRRGRRSSQKPAGAVTALGRLNSYASSSGDGRQLNPYAWGAANGEDKGETEHCAGLLAREVALECRLLGLGFARRSA